MVTTPPGASETPVVLDTPKPTPPLTTSTPRPGETDTPKPDTTPTIQPATGTPDVDTPADIDNDQDGFTDLDGDCDDFDNDIYPGAPEVPYNGDDEDCSGEDLTDVDKDGHDAEQAGGDDCNDNDGTVYPGATEVPDGEDNDCDGEVDDNIDDTDDDGDGYSEADGDCDDSNPDKNPGNPEIPYNGIDDDCDGQDLDDIDGDGSTGGAEGFDCNDDDASVNPGAEEVPYDGIDQNCDSEDLVDVDGDGAPGSGSGTLDCDDNDPDRAPSLTEIPYDGIDNNCDGVDLTDVDGDGFNSDVVDGTDCDDDDPAINPNGQEIPYNTIDEDCSGDDLADVDEDGYDAEVAGGDDCDDDDVNTHPGAGESGDGKDNDCDGQVDEGLDNIDNDGDGVSEEGGDCNDNNDDIYPGATEIPNDGIDQDCSGLDLSDGDGDGFSLPTDCDDQDPSINPDADEIPYDNIDQDCTGDDEQDVDNDGFSSTQVGGEDCDDTSALTNPDGVEKPYDGIDQDCSGADLTDVDEDGYDATVVSGGNDCNDGNPAINPGADELCDTIDNNCDNVVDSDAIDRDTYYEDGDHDGYGNPSKPVKMCTPSGSVVEDNTDCDDTSASSYPGGTEVCDTRDNNCNGQIDEDTQSTFYQDLDADGYGNPNQSTQACAAPSGYVADKTDCKDTNDTIHPGATELCDGLDQDCDGQIDEDAKVTFYRDNDKDLYGDAASSIQSCTPLSGYVIDKTDCNDNNAAINPGAQEICDSANTDENCNGTADNNDSTTQDSSETPYYVDGDKDGYGNSASTATLYCDNPSTSSLSFVTNNGDCNDSNPSINPGVTEICDPNNNDENCNGSADDSDPGTSSSGKTTWYPDVDKDGYGSSSNTGTSLCDNPSTSSNIFVTNKTDCNDSNATINPGATEFCDSANVDENCNGVADDNDSTTSASSKTTWYPDGDKDGYGDSNSTGTSLCENPNTSSNAFVTNKTDCNDSNAAINPGATEVCDVSNVDENCNGAADDNDSTTSPSGKSTWYPDGDKDGYGNSSSTGTLLCDNPSTSSSSFVTNKTDCNDSNAAVNPGASELCNGVDDNCNGQVDEGGGGVTGTSTFNFTGAEQTFTVPTCVSQITITAFGAEGVRATTAGAAVAGKGGMASGKMSVTGGQTFYIYVGGKNGYNGGAAGWSGSSNTCNGGGASDVRLGGNGLSNRVIVAGGGGGVSGETNWGNGGHGGGGSCGGNYCGGGGATAYYNATAGNGGTSGGSGTSDCHGGAGGGGGLNSGGGGAVSTCYGGATGGTGTLGFGGVGAATTSGCCQLYGVAGGGGGYYGGGGSAGGCCGGGGAGGGSSWTGTLSNPSFSPGSRSGNGVVVISW